MPGTALETRSDVEDQLGAPLRHPRSSNSSMRPWARSGDASICHGGCAFVRPPLTSEPAGTSSSSRPTPMRAIPSTTSTCCAPASSPSGHRRAHDECSNRARSHNRACRACRAGRRAAAGTTGVAAIDATFAGSFTVAGPDRSPIFTVTEAGRGSALGLPSGTFSYELWVVQELRRRPSGCGPNSSTGHHGLATLALADGHLRLRRDAGEACLSFPFVIGTEEWAAVGGSGPYRTSTVGIRRTFAAM